METVIGLVILAAAVFILTRSLLKSKNGGCGCGGCGTKKK